MHETREDRLTSESATHRIFLGENGLRAGWSCLLFALFCFLLGMVVHFALQPLLHHTRPPHTAEMPVSLMAIDEAIPAAVVLLATWIMSRVERRPFTMYGLGGRARLSRFLFGALWGLVALAALVGALCGLHFASVSGPTIHGGAAWRFGLLWGLAFLCTAIFEETLLRGFLQVTLARGIGFPWAALLLSVSFGLLHGHNPGESPVGLFSAAAIGLVFCISFWFTGSLWWAVGFHAAWDWSESFLWGTPDSGLMVQGHLLRFTAHGPLLWSGGLTGPEGSLLVIVVILVVAGAMFLWWGRKRTPEFPTMLRKHGIRHRTCLIPSQRGNERMPE